MGKIGLLTPDEEKFYGKLIAGNVKVPGIFKPIVGFGMPFLVKTIDNTYGDKIPEPWQTNIEKMTTLFYEALQDKVITPEERNEIGEYCVKVMNEHIDIPKLNEDQEAVRFLGFWKFVSTLIWGEVNSRVEE